jgi:vacuolar-type H+-ATPase subunit E/Vma4
MGVETIVEAIGSEAAAQIAAIESECDRTVDRIARETKNRADGERRKWAGSRDEEAERKRAGIVNRARLEADRRLAEVREELFQQALTRVAGMLGELADGSGYEAILRALCQEAIAIVPDEDATVLVRPEDRELAEHLIGERGGAGTVDATRSCIGGLDVETADGRCVRNTFDSRLALSERELRRLAVATIPEFAGSGSSA